MTAAMVLSVRGQTVLSGPYSGQTITGDVAILSSTSATFTAGSSFTGANATLGDNAFLNWNQNGSLAGKTFIVGNNSGIIVGPANTLTLGSATTATGGVWVYSDNAGASIANQGTITHNTGTGYLYAPTFSNQGSITANGGSGLYVGYTAGYSITNTSSGTITADGTNTSVYLRGIANQGGLTAQNGGALVLQGNNTTASLGTVTIGTGGGHAYLNNTLDNNSATLSAPIGGSFELYGGTINGGSIAAGALSFTGTGGVLNNVNYQGDLSLAANTTVSFSGSTNFIGTNASLGNYAMVGWYENGTLAGKTITLGTAAGFVVGGDYSLTLNNATGVSGGVYLYSDNAGAAITNQGIIHHTDGTGYIYAPTFVNQGSIAAGTNTNLFVGYTAGYSITNASTGTITADGANASIYLQGITNQGSLVAQNSGALYFQGPNTTASLGSVTIGTGGGHAYLRGTLDNTSATLSAPTGGSFELLGGTINYGTIAPGALTFTSSGGTLNNVSYGTTLTLPSNTSVTFTNGTGVGDVANLGDYSAIHWNQYVTIPRANMTFGTGAYIDIGAGGALTLDPTSSATGDVSIYSGNTGASIINQGTISHTSGTGYLYAPTFTNQGSITAGTNTSLWVGYTPGYSITNASGGTIAANGAGANVYVYGIVNQGALTAQNGGVLYFEGNNTTASLGTVTIGTGGGHAYLYNTLDNTGATLTAPTGGSFELYAGTINNGTIGAGALTFTGSAGTLSNVSYTGDFALPASTYVTFTNGTAFTGANATLGNGAGLYWNQNSTLTGKALSLSPNAYVYVGINNALTLDSASTVTGDVSLYSYNTGASIINQGTITHTSGTGELYASTFTNQGTITAGADTTLNFGYSGANTTTNASGGTLTADGTNANVWLYNAKNQGALKAQNGGALFFWGDNNTTANLGNVTIGTGGGHAYLYGKFDNTAATLTAPTGGSYELYYGTINNGTIAPGALTFTGATGTLSNVSYTGDLTLPTFTYVTLTNGTGFTGTTATLADNAGLYWSQNGTLTGKAVTMGPGSYVYIGASSALTLGSATAVTGGVQLYSGETGASITNQGTITHNSGTGYLYANTFTNQGAINIGTGTTMYLGSSLSGYTLANTTSGSINVTGGYLNLPGPLTNDGLINVQSGTLWTNYSSSNLINGSTGTIMGSGTIIGNLTVDGGTISPGNSIGTLTLASGGLIVNNAATLMIELGGATADQLLIQTPPGVVDIGAGLLALTFNLVGEPTASTYNLISITAGSGFTGYLAGFPNSGDPLTAVYLGTPYTFSVQYLTSGVSLNFAAVPEPSTLALLAAGLLMTAGSGLRRLRRTR